MQQYNGTTEKGHQLNKWIDTIVKTTGVMSLVNIKKCYQAIEMFSYCLWKQL